MHSEFKMGDQVDDQQVSCLWQGEYLLSVSLSGHINYLDRNNPDRPLRVLKGHNKNLSAIASFNNGSTLYSASFDGRIDILKLSYTVCMLFWLKNCLSRAYTLHHVWAMFTVGKSCFFNFPHFIGIRRMVIWTMLLDAHTLTKSAGLHQLQTNCTLLHWTNCSEIFCQPARNMGNYKCTCIICMYF